MKAYIRIIIAVTIVLTLALALLPLSSQPAIAVGDMGKQGHSTTISLGASHSAAIAANGD